MFLDSVSWPGGSSVLCAVGWISEIAGRLRVASLTWLAVSANCQLGTEIQERSFQAAKAEAADFLRPSPSGYKVSLLPLTVGQKKSKGQPRFKGKGNRFHLLRGRVEKNLWPSLTYYTHFPSVRQIWINLPKILVLSWHLMMTPCLVQV